MSKGTAAFWRAGRVLPLLLVLLLASCSLPGRPSALTRVPAEPTAVPTPVPAEPTVAPPPTAAPVQPSTAPSPSPRAVADRVVYVREGTLWFYDGQATRSLATRGSVDEPLLSPDGRRVLYRRQEKPTELSGEPFSLWLLDLQTGQETAVDLASLPSYPLDFEGRTLNLPRWPAVIQWLPDGQSLLFNTRVDFSAVGPGGSSGDDLWQVDAATGQVRRLFEEVQPPASFTIGPDGQWLLVNRPTRIEALHLFTGERRTLVEYPAVSTYSEYAWLPQPHWLSDGRTAHVAIAPADPMSSSSYALWRLDVEKGAAQQLGQVEGAVFAWSPSGQSWSPDGRRLVYLGGDAEKRQVRIADATGMGITPLAVVSGPFTLLGWSPDGQRALYAEETALYLVEDGLQPQVRRLADVGSVAARAAWLADGLLVVTEDGRLLRVPLAGTRVEEIGP